MLYEVVRVGTEVRQQSFVSYQQSNNTDEARRWLEKATDWLDQQEGRMPRETTDMGSHRHNWLEALILRDEVEKLLAPGAE